MANNIARAKYLRISPFKVRRIANEIIKKNVLEAEAYLSVLPNKGALALKKVIHSARTNFLSKNSEVNEDNLIVNKILIDAGSTYKRYQPISRGRANRILKRTCQIFVEVEERKEKSEQKSINQSKEKIDKKSKATKKEKGKTTKKEKERDK